MSQGADTPGPAEPDPDAVRPGEAGTGGVAPRPGIETGAADSAGVPWSGRSLNPQPYAGDDGTSSADLVAALAEWSSAVGDFGGPHGGLAAVVRAWAPSRVLVPIVAVLGEGDDVAAAAEEGHGDKSADMALVTMTLSNGLRALPAFSSIAAMAAWHADARPVPVEAARAAQSAVVEGCDVILIDAAGPIPCTLPRTVVWAVAQGREWLAPAHDVEVLAGIAAMVRAVPPVVAHRVEPYGPDGLIVVLGLPPGLPPEQVQQATGRVSQLLAADPIVSERTGSIRLSVRAV